jgi:adenosylcobinamide-phosphate guanylyltransferase
MDALINAGGKGTRMGRCGVEKPMMDMGGVPTVYRVVEALRASSHIDRILVTVSGNTPRTESFLCGQNIETVHTSGESFMDDLHAAFELMDSDFVLTCPSDLPLMSTSCVDSLIELFDPGSMESLMALVDADLVRDIGITPSYTHDMDGKEWVISGLSIMDRKRTLAGEYLTDSYLQTNWFEISVNVNTKHELSLARKYLSE